LTSTSTADREAPDADRLKPAGGYWRVVILLMFVVGLAHFNRVGMSVAGAERIIPGYHVTPAQMGLVYSAFLLFYTLAMLPGGWLIDRYGARTALVLYGFGSAVFVALTGCVGMAFHDAWGVWLGLLVVRSLMGITNAPLHPAAAAMIYQHVPHGSKSRANGSVTFAACLGIAATFYVLGTLMDRLDWPPAFLVCSVLTLAITCVWWLGTRQGGAHSTVHEQRIKPSLADVLSVLRQPGLICITLSYSALGFFQYLFFYWIEYYFETIQRQGVEVARQYAMLTTLAMGVGMACGGWLSDQVPESLPPRVRRGLVPVVGMIASGVIFEAGLLAADTRIILAAFIVSAALLGACEGAFWTTVVALGGRLGGTAAGLMNAGGNAGGTLSPYVTPLLGAFFATHYGQEMGWRLGLSVAGVVSILGALLWWGVEPTMSSPQGKCEESET
jgi:MFS transporter, ACS family, D-galactonate transporter